MASALKLFKYIISKPELVFVILALFFGLVYTFKLAPLRGTDEFTHFARVYQISEGTLWEQKLPGNQYGGKLPVNVNNMINDFRKLSYQNFSGNYTTQKQALISKYSHISAPGHTSVQTSFTSSYLYPPWAYIEDLAGLFIAKAASLPLVWYVYLARISSLLFWIVTVWFAIKLLPAGKWFLTAIALVPTSLSQAATISGDGLLISLAWLIFALTMAVLAKKVKFGLKTQIFLAAVAVLMCILKNGYYLIGLFPLIIPSSLFKNRKSANVWRGVTFCLVAVASLIFMSLAVKDVSNTPTILYPNHNINTHAQITYIGHHLFLYIFRMFGWLATYSYDIIFLSIVGVVTNHTVVLPFALILLSYYALYATYMRIEPVGTLADHSKRLRIGALIVLIGTYIFIVSAFYLNSTSVGAASVNSVWGRYFLPLIPFFAIFAFTSKKKMNLKVTNAFKYLIYVVLTFTLASTMFYIN